jgi:RNA polymerase sigma factor (sigma-70 family)
MTDQQLLTNFLSDRDEAAFEAVVLRYGPMVLRVCRDVLDRPADAEDAFQATFLVLFRQAGSIRDRSSLGRWLCEVAWRISRRERRRVARLRSQERQALEMDGEARSDNDPADREVKPILQDEIRRLPSKLRDPILLCYFEGLTVEDAARRLRVPIGTIKSRLAKGRELLRSRLTRRGLAASTMLLLMFGLTEEIPAAVPSRLVSSTVEAGLRGSSGSRRIAAMVKAEESRHAWFPLGNYWMLFLGAIVVFGAIRLAPAGIVHAASLLAPVWAGAAGAEAKTPCQGGAH